jgi:hypothetical protein
MRRNQVAQLSRVSDSHNLLIQLNVDETSTIPCSFCISISSPQVHRVLDDEGIDVADGGLLVTNLAQAQQRHLVWHDPERLECACPIRKKQYVKICGWWRGRGSNGDSKDK